MSPAIDALVKLPSAPKGEGEIFKNVADEENVGGKAINVARWLAIRSRTGSLVPPSAHSLPGQNCSVVCGGLLGEDNAAPFAKELAKHGIEDCFLRVPGSTRRNEMITWPGGSVKLNRAAFPQVQQEDCIGIGDLPGFDRLEKSDVVIMSGSLPQNFLPSFYAVCITALKAAGVKTVLDASGAALQYGLKMHPDLIKPNAEECEPLVGFVPKTPDEFRTATEMLRKECAHVIISDGGAGAWFDGVFVPAPQVEVVDTTAAGDTLLAEWCFSHDPYLAVAAGSAACTMPGSQPPDVDTVRQLKDACYSA